MMDQPNVKRNYRKLQAWVLHHLKIDPSSCGVKKSYGHFFGFETLAQAKPTSAVKQDPLVKREPVVKPEPVMPEAVILRKKPVVPETTIPTRDPDDRANLNHLTLHKRPRDSSGSEQAAIRTNHKRRRLIPFLPKRLEAMLQLPPEQVKVERQQEPPQEPSPREDVVTKAEHDAVVAALKAEIASLRENEERLLTLGLSWEKGRDDLLRTAA